MTCLDKVLFFGVVSAFAVAGNLSAHADGSEASDRMDVVRVQTDRNLGDPGSFSQLAEDVLQRIGADHPAEILNLVPGVNIQMNSGQEHLIALRSPVLTAGAGQGSFLVLVDGIATRAPAFGNVNALLEIPYETAQAIEVIRGPGSPKYGSNAVHGMINVLQQVPESDAESFLKLSASTLERFRLDSVFATEKMRVGASLQEDLGWRDDTGVSQQKFSFQYAGTLEAWDLKSSLFATNLNQETAGFVQGVDAYRDENLIKTNPNPEAFRDAVYARASFAASRSVADGVLSITPFAIFQQMQFSQHFLPYKGLEKNGHYSMGAQTKYDFRNSWGEWSVGADGQWAEGYLSETQSTPFGFFPSDRRYPVGIHYDYTVDTKSIAAFTQLRMQITPDLAMLSGVRFEHHDYDYVTNTPAGVFGLFKIADDRSDNFDLLTPKLGFVWSGLEQADFYLNYAKGQRAPQASDLYRLQSQQGIGEAKVEDLNSLELGVRGQIQSNINYDIAAYAMEKEQFFFRDANGLNVPEGATDHWGFEATLAQQNVVGFSWNINASYAEHNYAFDRLVSNASEIIIDGNQIDTAPKWLLDAELAYKFENASLSVELDHVGKYFTNASNSTTYPGHTLLGMRGSFDLSQKVKLFASIRNILDEKYADRADFAFGQERYFPGEPRSAILGIRISR